MHFKHYVRTGADLLRAVRAATAWANSPGSQSDQLQTAIEDLFAFASSAAIRDRRAHDLPFGIAGEVTRLRSSCIGIDVMNRTL